MAASLMVMTGMITVVAPPSAVAAAPPPPVSTVKPAVTSRGGAGAVVVPVERHPAAAKPAVWPRATSQVVAVTADTGAVGVTGSDRPLVTLSSAANGLTKGATAMSAQALKPTVAAARVKVLDHAAAVNAGVSGMLFTVSRADSDAATAAPVRATIDYSGMADGYGADFRHRLRLVAYPACVLTTPTVAACAKGTAVPADNDPTGQKITATVQASAVPATASMVSLSAGTVYALTSTPSSGAVGNYAATSLKDSDSWNVGAQSGSFSYNYPIAVPPAPGGMAPGLDLSYNSQSVDGRTSATNGQASDVGMGWDRSQPYIERKYRSCADQWTFSGGTSGVAGSGDACWDANKVADNATLSMDGLGSPLVQNAQNTSQWMLKNDNGWTVQLLTGASNDDEDGGEYWVVTTTEGVKYYFGLGHTPTSGNATSSVQREPVFGKASCNTNPNPPGGHQFCYKAYRWNLDYVVDPHGNTQSWYYNRDGNTYYQSQNAGMKLGYTRDAYVADILYGTNVNVDPNHYQTGWVHFDYGYRCYNGTPIIPGSCTAPNSGSTFPDVPSDLICTTQTMCPANSPTFYHTKVLTGIITRAADNTAGVTQSVAGWRDVDHYDFSYSFLATGEVQTSAALWLRNISHIGYAADGSTMSAPQITWLYSTWKQVNGVSTATPLPNRVDTDSPTGQRPPINMYRLGEVVTPLGGVVRVDYFQPDPCTSAGALDVMSPTAGHSNLDNYDCYAQYLGTGTGGSGRSDTPYGWFNKYLVQYTAVQDAAVGGGDTINLGGGSTYNAYNGYAYTTAASEGDSNSGAAWRFPTESITPAGPAMTQRAWSDYRGYRGVTVTHAAAVCDEAACSQGTVDSKDAYVYFRGMDQDCLDKQCTTRKSVSVTSSFINDTQLPNTTDPTSSSRGAADSTPDAWQWNGMLRAHQHLDAAGNQVSGMVDWHSLISNPGGRTAITNALGSQTSMAKPLFDVIWHANLNYHYTSYSYDNVGQVHTTSTRDHNNVSYRCVMTYYARSGSAAPSDPTWELPSRTEHWNGDCYSGTEDGWTINEYDGYSGDGFSEPLSKGDLTTVLNFTDSTHAISSSGRFDGYGRRISFTDGDGNTTTTAYGGLFNNPLTVTTTNAAGQVSTVALDQGRGLTEQSTDVNGNVTTIGYDALGRTTNVWQPGDTYTGSLWHPSGGSPTDTFAYQTISFDQINKVASGDNMVTSGHRQPSGSGYIYSYAYVDGLGRTFETATASPDGTSSIFTATMFDAQGRTVRQIAPFQVANTAPGTFWRTVNSTASLRETDTSYDAASRPVRVSTVYQAATVARNGVLMTTTTAYADDHATITSPAPTGTGTITTTSWLDEFGRVSKADQAGPSGTLSTVYEHDDHDNLTKVTDPAGRISTFGYDLLGRRVVSTDPDTGGISSVLDNNGNAVSTTDALNQIIVNGYDRLGRKTSIASATSGYPTVNGNAGLWKLADGSGTTARDNGGSHPLTTGSGVTWSSERGGSAVFNGTAGATATAAGPVLTTTSSFSVSAWAKPLAYNGVVASQKGTSSSAFILWPEATDSTWRFGLSPTDDNSWTYDQTISSTRVTLGAWTHLVATFDAATGKTALYVNGALAGTGTHTTTHAFTGAFQVGTYQYQGANVAGFNGSLSDVQVYQRALSAAEAATLASAVGTYTYDASGVPGSTGRLTSQTAYVGGSAYTSTVTGYDNRGRATGSSWVIPSSEPGLGGKTYTESVGYDAAGNQNTLTYPSNDGLPAETVTTNYDQFGNPTTMAGLQTYVAGTTMDPLDRLIGRTLGTGAGVTAVSRTLGYESDTGTLATVSAATGSTTFQNDTYVRNAAGEVTSLTDNANGQAQCYTYDLLARMTRAFTTTAAANCASANHTFTPVTGETPYDTTYAYTAPTRTVANPAYVTRVASDAQILSTASVTIPVSTATRAGDALLVSVYLSGTTAAAAGASDTQGNTYTVSASHLDSSGHRLLVLSALNTRALSTTDQITITFPTASKYQVAVDEFAGVSSVDKTATATGAAGGTTYSTGNATTTVANELLFATTGTNSGTAATYDPGWNTLAGTALSSYKLTPAWKAVTSTGSYAATGTTTAQWQSAMVTLKAVTQTLPAVTDAMNALATVTDNISATATEYGYTDAAHEHAATVVGASSYAYDANGNQTSRTVAGVTTTLTWSQALQLTALTNTGGTTGDVYGPEGTRLIRHDPNGDSELFLGGEELVYTKATGTVATTRYYHDGTATVASRTSAGVTWLLSDVQGTASAAVNAATGAIVRQYYTPFGAQRGGQVLRPITDHAFLGRVEDYGVGLLQDGARYYDPATGTFISPDPVNTGSPSQSNAYAYAANNPATMSDPSGLNAYPATFCTINGGYWVHGQCDWTGASLVSDSDAEDQATAGCHSGNCINHVLNNLHNDPSLMQKHKEAVAEQRLAAAEYTAKLAADCSASGGAFSGGNCVHPPPPAPKKKHWWQKALKQVGDVLGAVSTYTGYLGFLPPPVGEVAGFVSLVTGVGAAGAYLGATAYNEAAFQLLGTVLSVSTGGLGTVGKLEKVSSKGASGFAKASEAFDNSVFRLKSLPSMEKKTTQVAAFDGRGIITPHKLTTTDLGRTPVDSNLLNGVVTAATSGNSPLPMISDAGLWSAPETDGF